MAQTYNDVVASAKALCDLEAGDDQGGDAATLALWFNEDWSDFIRRVALKDPDHYTITVTPTVSTALGTLTHGNILAWSNVRKVGRIVNNVIYWLPQKGYMTDHLTVPADMSGTWAVEVILIPTTPTGSIPFDAPPGSERILIHMLARRMRIRLDMSTTAHDEAIERLWKELDEYLTPQTSTPESISDHCADFGSTNMYWRKHGLTVFIREAA